MTQFENRVAIVTGAAQGIGLGIAQVLAGKGARVAMADVQRDPGVKAAEAIRSKGGRAEFVQGDVSRLDDVQALVEGTASRFGRLDIVVNNAGICTVKTAEEMTAVEWDYLMAVNVRAIFLTTKFAVPHMRRQGGGCIVNVASVSSFVGQQKTPAYCASKGAVLMLTKSLAVDYAPERIRVNCVCPGITDTPLFRHHLSHALDPEARLRERLRRVPAGELLQPEDIGQAVAFLCSDEARGITGTALVVDGGYSSCAEFFNQ